MTYDSTAARAAAIEPAEKAAKRRILADSFMSKDWIMWFSMTA